MTAQNDNLKNKADIQAINAAMMDLHFEEGWSVKRIHEDPRYNRAVNTIQALIRVEKLKNRVRKKSDRYDPRRMENRRVLSATHVKLGVLVGRYESVHKINHTGFGLLVNMTRNQVSELCSGSYDIKLSEMVRICEVLDIEVTELFTGMHRGVITATKAAA